MPVKKKKSSGGKKAKVKSTMPPFEYEAPVRQEKPSEFVKCRVCSTALPHLNFEWAAVPTDLTLDVIKDAIAKRHGGALLGIMLYRDMVHPDTCVLAEDSSSLRDLGVVGVLPGALGASELPTVTFFYDFRAVQAGDPIVNVEYGAVQSKYDVPLKAYIRLQNHGVVG